MEDIDYVMTENELYDLIERQQRLQQRAETLEHCVQLRIVASEAIRDRNAATECMAELKMELATLEKDAGDKCFREQQRADAAERERDQALGQSQRAVSEAEEWEKLYDQIKAERDDWKRECDALAKERTQLRKERDEALSRATNLELERDEARYWARKLYRQCMLRFVGY